MPRAKIFRWYAVFTDGRGNMEEEERSGRPASTKTDENIARVADILKAERRCWCRLIEEKTKIPKEIIQCILREDLKKNKACTVLCRMR